MPINIEITDSPDMAVLATIHTACFKTGWDAAAMAELFAIPGTMAFITEGGKGFGLLRHLGEEAEILTFAVLPAYRRKGMGVAIIKIMRQWAQKQGAKAIFLEVGEHNAAALELYYKMQFAIISRRKDYYCKEDGSREDAIVMRCGL